MRLKAKLFSYFARLIVLGALLASTMASRPAGSFQQPAWQSKIDDWVLQTAEEGRTEFLVMLQEQADLSGAGRLRTKQEKGAYVYQQLTRTAERSQGPVLAALQTMTAQSPGEVDYRAFWIANMIWVRGDSRVVQALAQREDVA